MPRNAAPGHSAVWYVTHLRGSVAVVPVTTFYAGWPSAASALARPEPLVEGGRTAAPVEDVSAGLLWTAEHA